MAENLPLIEFENLFHEDHFGQKFWKALLGPDNFKKFKDQYELMGRAGAIATSLSDTADKSGPELVKFNRVGDRIDEVIYHPAYKELQKLSYGNGIVAKKYNSPLIDKEKPLRHLVGFSTAYYFAQTETGLFCPICMTDALGFVLEKHQGDLPQVKKTLEHIGSSNMDEFWQGAMFLTEKQGGSDVGANTVRSEKKGDEWLLYGTKWFCSNVDAESALVLARLPGEEGDLKHGTKGLGLFLVLRHDPPENFKNFEIHRLKEKLGVRSMASGEVTFNGTRGHLLGGFGEGFKMMAEMVNMSRLYNSVASLAIARRSLLEAKAFASKRKAFGVDVENLPLWRSSYADLSSEFVLLKSLVFETIRELDKGENGDENAKKVSRILTPICKALTGKFSVFAASECMELIGGNAYIEEHIMPRLLRDAQVLPIWEGTTHIQSLDVLRSLKKEGIEPLKLRLKQALEVAADKDIKDFVTAEQEKLYSKIADLMKMDANEVQRASRSLLEQMGRAVGLSFVLELSIHEELKDAALATIKRFQSKAVFLQSPSAVYSADNAEAEKALML